MTGNEHHLSLADLRAIPKEVTEVPTEEAPSLAAAAFMAVLAYPESLDDRDTFIECFKAAWFKNAVREGYPRDDIPHTYRELPNQKINNVFNKATKRIGGRLHAVALLNHRLMGATGFFTIDGKTASTNAVAGWISLWKKSGRMDRESRVRMEKRNLAESLSVAHIAQALNERLLRFHEPGSHPSVWSMLVESDWILDAVKRSNNNLRFWLPAALHGHSLPPKLICLVPQKP